ncbi:hypothetical protein ABZX40_38210 [Streptomyces sp. NPDC004610]|uniref:hypothetical protein n=1 Tax=unclassified Streptomyces TaxID=2593676 RepID=UPI0033B0F419
MMLRRAVAPIAILIFTAVLSSCGESGKSRDYAVPSSLCGTSIGTDALDPFFPSGQNISTSADDDAGIKSCQVTVDNTVVMTTTQVWLERGQTTAYFAQGISLEKLDHSFDDNRFRYSDTEAFGKTRTCVDDEYDQELYTAVQVSDSDHKDAEAMKQVIVAYTGEVEESAECAEGSS